MKIFIRYIISFMLALLASCIAYRITFEIVEYIDPSKRYNANGDPQFVMPTLAIFWGLITSIIIFISAIIWLNKMFKNKFDKK